MSHAQLLRAVWSPAREDRVDYLRIAVRGLRQNLEKDASRPRLIVNEVAVGYRLRARFPEERS
ncbi:MAG TPA: winged helix-turn-helix domain-containing protein [Sphingobium sp.]|nr:winged helix-turn-helix domain-containing protein [Sphingobium sp.]